MLANTINAFYILLYGNKRLLILSYLKYCKSKNHFLSDCFKNKEFMNAPLKDCFVDVLLMIS